MQDPIDVVADYSDTVFGTWRVEVSVAGRRVGQADGTTIEDAFTEALDILERIANDHRRPCATVHMLRGDPAAFAALAEVHGLGT